MATGCGGERCRPERSITWVGSDGTPLSTESTTRDERDEDGGGSIPKNDLVDLEFEWYRLCHGCGEQKWFRALICDDCRRRHGIARR